MALTAHDTAKLVGCHPRLVSAVTALLNAMTALGHPMMVTDGLRSTAQQQALYARGRTTAGPKVTNADGIVKRSNHQRHDDGLGWAADCAFVVDGLPSWDVRLPWKTYGVLANTFKLRWGGSWSSLHDLPHVELDPLRFKEPL